MQNWQKKSFRIVCKFPKYKFGSGVERVFHRRLTMVVTGDEFLARPRPGDEVVISGMSGRFPESDNVDQFFRNICDKTEMITDDDRRWKHTNPEIPHRVGKINHLHKMDAGAFGLHYLQVHEIDPMFRIMLERAYEVILDAGYSINEMRGTKTGVFIGGSLSESEKLLLFYDLKSPHFGVLGCFRSMISQRISATFGFDGPSFLLDTACSSSMYAFEKAYRAIREGVCEYALVGGINLCLNSLSSLQFNRLGVLSMDGTCKVFDDKANGYARSESISIVFLQKARSARRIYGQVVHCKANCDGYKEQGLIFPSGPMQAVLIKDIYRECGVDPARIDFLEAHGTGTSVGDQEEMTAMDEVYCANRSSPLIVGSIKSHIGHSESASGLSSLIKVLFSMEIGCILPNINYDTPRRTIKALVEGRMVVPTDIMPWPENGSGLVGLNSSGFGGSNVHVLLKRFSKPKTEVLDDLPRLLCVSGRTERAVFKILNTVSERKLDVEYIALLQRAFKNTGLEHLHRGYIVQTKRGNVAKAVGLIQGERTRLSLVLTFGDSTLLTLGRRCMALPTFSEFLRKIDSVASTQVSDIVAEGSWSSPSKVATCTIAIQLGLLDLFERLQLVFDEVIGTSVGEIVAAYANGRLSLEEAVLNGHRWVESENVDEFSLNGVLDAPNSMVVVIGKAPVGENPRVLTVKGNTVESLFDLLGKIYILGYHLDCECLCPVARWPVSNRTPRISSIIRWNYSDDWYVCFENKLQNDHTRQTSLMNKEMDWSVLLGHNIDGMVLMPATGYVYLAVDHFCKAKCLNMFECALMLEDVKFHKATPIPKAIQTVVFQTYLFKNTNRFEILNDNELIASGYINQLHGETDSSNSSHGEASSEKELTTVDIYKELKLRGYNYTDGFRCIHNCNLNGKHSWVKWDDNYVTFMDNMLQTILLQQDTRNLYVPTSIGQIILDVSKHHQFSSSFDSLLPVYSCAEANTISCGGIQINGLFPSGIPRRKMRGEPVLEKSVFVPLDAHMPLEDIVRAYVQLILENTLNVNVKTVEVLDDRDPRSLVPLIQRAVEDVPLLKYDVTVFTSTDTEIPNAKVVDGCLEEETQCSLIILTDAARHPQIEWATSALKENGFLISRQNSTWDHRVDGLKVIATAAAGDESVVLLRKISEIRADHVLKVALDGSDFAWIPVLQDLMKKRQKVLLINENESCSGALGFINCLRREYTLLQAVVIMDRDVRFDADDEFFQNQLKKSLAINVLKDGRWGTYRHLLIGQQSHVEKKNANCYITRVGDLSSLRWIERPPHEDDGATVEIYYSAINFKDLALASGLISSDTFTQHRLEQMSCFRQGMEFAGKDSRGKRVMGISILGGSLSDRLSTSSTTIWDVPDEWSMREAATVPVCYSTVLLGLQTARIRPGDSILIHAGSGGIGQAALHIATWYRCTIFTTVSTEDKRLFIRERFPHVLDSHIGNSRDTSFEEIVFKETRGRGVDIVLNSLTEEKLVASLRCLAPRGRFIDIGKYDLLKNRNMAMSMLTQGRAYCSVMLDLLGSAPAPFQKKICKTLDSFIDKSVIKPLESTVFGHDEVEKAYRFMAAGKHVGKLLLRVREEHEPPTTFKCLSRFHCSARSTYVIVGGLGGVGLELADWLVIRGARKLMFVSRTGLRSGYANSRINVWKSYEVTIEVATDDATTRDGCRALLRTASRLGEVAAIFNLALVLKDEMFENQNADKFLAVLSPKAVVAHNLDVNSRDLCPKLRHFVVFSSIVCGRGNIGQTPYGLANSIMERICENRKALGYPALAIQWGAIGEVGIIVEMTDRRVDISGTSQQRIQSCWGVLDAFLNQDAAVVSSIVIAEKFSTEGAADVIDIIKNVLGITDLKTVSQHATLPELGMDSMTALEIKTTLERECDIYLNPKDIRTMTFARLKEMLENRKTESAYDLLQPKYSVFYKFVGNEGEANIPIKRLTSLVGADTVAPTVIILPGIEGMASVMEPLASNLEAHVYCLQYVYDSTDDDTIEFLAQKALPFIPPDEPFNLVAYSFGSIVALELVALLEARDQKGIAILVDGSQDMLKAVISQGPGLDSPALLDTMALTNLMQFHMSKEEVAKHQVHIMQCDTLSERVEYVLSVASKDTPHSVVYQRQVCLKSCMRIRTIFSYVSNKPKLRSSVILFKPSQPTITNFDEDYGIQKMCEKPVSITVVEGNHLTILKNRELADQVNGILAEPNL